MPRQLLQAALVYVPEDAPLHAQIAAFLGEPVHVGDTITIKAGYPRDEGGWSPGTYDGKTHEFAPNEDELAGMTVRHHESTIPGTDGKIKTYTYQTYTWPEAGPARYITSQDYDGGFVVVINDRRYRVDIHIQSDDGIPCDAVVTFTRTEADETGFQTWSHEDALAKYRAGKVKTLESRQAALEKDPDGDWAEDHREDIARAEEDIKDVDTGDVRLRHPFYAQVLGQPCFMQGEFFPMHNGRVGSALVSIETGWGDSGNVNILFACDDDGVPCAAWFEASSA